MSEAWPRRNLGRGEHWGRVIEKRVEGLSGIALRQDQSRDGLGRFTASTAESVSSVADKVLQALLSLPSPFSSTSYSAGFGIPTSWTTVASVSLGAPEGFNRLEVSAVGACTSYQVGVSTVKFTWPFSLDYVTSEFGPRPPLPFHNGIDFAWGGCEGTAIPAAHNGVVILSGYYSDWGNYVRVDCSPLTGLPNSWTGYAHMMSTPSVSVGDTVTRGQTLGYIGSTGFVTGAHLHYETATEDSRINPRDFMSMFGGGSGVGLYKTIARLVVNGVPSLEFEPYRGDDIPRFQSQHPVHGLSRFDTTMTVELQMRATGAVSANSQNTATLTVQGAFSRG